VGYREWGRAKETAMKKQPLQELHDQLVLIKDRVRGVVHGHANGMYLHGRPGTSKTHSVRTTLEQLNVPSVSHSGHLTPVGLFGLLRENPQSILVLDDVSSILSQPVALQILLASLGSPPDGSRTRTVRYKSAKGDEVVRFLGGIIVITNLPLADHDNAVLGALRDRVHVIGYEPTDEQIEAFIYELAESSPRGIPADEALTVARYLVSECRNCGVRPSVRLFMDKALPDYRQWAEQKSQSHWQDLVRSSLQEEAVARVHPLQDVSRSERTESERRLIVSLYEEMKDAKEMVQEWKERTGKGKSAFYRRLNELKARGDVRGFAS
jgi:hypothetical protein